MPTSLAVLKIFAIKQRNIYQFRCMSSFRNLNILSVLIGIYEQAVESVPDIGELSQIWDDPSLFFEKEALSNPVGGGGCAKNAEKNYI